MTAYPIQAFERRKDEAVEALAILRSWDRCARHAARPRHGHRHSPRRAHRPGPHDRRSRGARNLYRWNLALISPLAWPPACLGHDDDKKDLHAQPC